LIRDHGRLHDITGFENERRAELGLPALAEQPEEYQQILAATGIEALVQPAEGGAE